MLTSTSLLILLILCGKRVTYGIFWRWAGSGAGVFCVADIDGHFVRQAWHSVASTFTLPGRLLILTLTLCGRSDNSYGNGSGGALGRIWRCGTLSGSWLFGLLFLATRFDAKRDCRALTRQAFQIPDKIVTCHVKTVSRPNVLALVDMSVTRYVLPITLSSLMEVPFWRFSWLFRFNFNRALFS